MNAADHFDDEFLIRLLHDPAELQRSGREQHFNACRSCRDQLDLYKRVQSFLQREPEFEVPADWVTRMVRMFEAEQHRKSSRASTEIFAWLVFDSLLADAAGIRSPARAATERHLIWQSPRLRIDMLIESADPDQVVIVGQLVERECGKESMQDGTTVEVTVGEDVFTADVEATGEFIVALGRLTRLRPMQLRFRLADGRSVILLMPD